MVNTATFPSFVVNRCAFCLVVIVSNADGTVEEDDEEEEEEDSDKRMKPDDSGNSGKPGSRASVGNVQQKRNKSDAYQVLTQEVTLDVLQLL